MRLNLEQLADLSQQHAVGLISAKVLADWLRGTPKTKLLLPPIQRTLVWDNKQIIDYWDSLLRGYPPGMMLVHPAASCTEPRLRVGRNESSDTVTARENDWQLFDGQQRITTLLLGAGDGPLKERVKLWVDFGIKLDPYSRLKFALRISTPGQPFGYRVQEPNQKLELSKRAEMWAEWKEANPTLTAKEAFSNARGSDIIGSKCAVPLKEIYNVFDIGGETAVYERFRSMDGAIEEVVESFAGALTAVFSAEIVLSILSGAVLSCEDDYVRFFERIGRGGTSLTDDELTYSLIKHRYPDVHDRMMSVMSGEAGRLSGEVDLVLGTIRVAKVLAPWENAKIWEIVSRPNAKFVFDLEKYPSVVKAFQNLIPSLLQDGSLDYGSLERALITARRVLVYAPNNPGGLPPMLLARLPKQLVDVLLLCAVKSGDVVSAEDCGAWRALTLYWLLFVVNHDKAAEEIFGLAARDKDWRISPMTSRELIRTWERSGAALEIPRKEHLAPLKAAVNAGTSHLRNWAERFAEIDTAHEGKPGEALRILSTKVELIKRALMWLQREYLNEAFPHFDPTSDRDEDLPVDLDHIVPEGIFAINWSPGWFADLNDMENFRWRRKDVGNSLGNYRLLCASENRHRQTSQLTLNVSRTRGGERFDFIEDYLVWNSVIPQKRAKPLWSDMQVATFQRLVDSRTLDLYERILTEGGIEKIISD